MTTDILTPTSYIILPILQLADYFERKFYSNLIKPEVGIYKYGNRNPTLRFGQQYFILNTKDKNKRVPLVDFKNITNGDYVVDVNGVMLLTPNDIVNRDTFLCNQPTVPVIGLKLVKLCVALHIASFNQYSNEMTLRKSELSRLFVNCDIDKVDEAIGDPVLSSLYDQVSNFVGKDINHVYFYRQTISNDLVIEKTIDWRAYQWELSRNNDADHEFNNL